MTQQEKQEIMKEYATHEGDTGSPEVQIAVKNEECLKKARKARRLEREFSMAVPAELYDRMEADLKNDELADP